MDCIITHIDAPFRPGNFSIDFDLSQLSTQSAMPIHFEEFIDDNFRIVGIGDSNELKSTSIKTPSAPAYSDKIIIYSFNLSSGWWGKNLRSDSFTVRFKDMVTREIVASTVTIRGVEIPEFTGGSVPEKPKNITIKVKYPYPEILLVNLNKAWSDPNNTPDYMAYKTGLTNPAFVSSALVPEDDPTSLQIDLEELAAQDTSIVIPFYVAYAQDGKVNEEEDTFGFANLILDFDQ